MVAAAFVMLAFIHLALSPIPVNAAQPKLAEIRDARLAGDASRTRFVADLDTPLSYSVYVVSDPYRVIVDMPGVRFILPPDSGDQGKGLVKSYRFGLLEPGKSRIVLDTTGPVLIEKSFVLNAENGQPARMVIDMVQTDQRTFARIKANELPEQASQSPEIAEQTASETEQAISVEQPDTLAALLAREGVAPLDQQASSEADQTSFVPKPRPKPDSQSAGHEEKAPETPNAKPVIVLDPGHGGIDGGTVSKAGTIEKNVVLDFALKLRKELNATGRYEVHLTRNDDTFISLAKRVRIARQNNADLFIAIHADSLRQSRVRGATVYTLSEKASDEEAAILAEKENAADIVAGVDLGEELDAEIGNILMDLALRETKNHSIYFARRLVKNMKSTTALNSRPMRSAGFKVLRAPDVPSVLLELGYLSNRHDEKALVSEAWRKKVAVAVTAAIDGFFSPEVAAKQQRVE